MNKVFDVSNDCGVKIYYQDTDSIHLKRLYAEREQARSNNNTNIIPIY